MTFHEYIRHYTSPLPVTGMLLAAALSVAVCLAIICAAARSMSGRYTADMRRAFMRQEVRSLTERFYELIFSNTAILLFVSMYFMVDYFGAGVRYRELWDKYNGIILLGFLMGSMLLISFVDNLIIPLKHVKPGERAAMRLMGMLYMLIIFAYIKFIYEDDNYDSIVIYFLSMVIGRFVYFDASLESFSDTMKDSARSLPLLFLALLCTVALSVFGWGSGYLLRVNGVVFNLFLAHLYLLLVIFIVHWVVIFRDR